jgi:mannose/fructose/N-acetylgalactosamine-specific phosphotransferase system component IIB
MIVLSRIDDRLIHGQVVEGWLRVIQAERIVVVSDHAASDVFQAGLMRLAVPPEVDLTVLPVDEAAVPLAQAAREPRRIMVVMPGLKEARRLAEAGWTPDSLNLGGLHDAPGRKSYTPSLSLGPDDLADIRFLLGKKISIETRALPGDDKKSVEEYLGGRP